MVYGFFFLLFWAAIGALIYFIYLRPAPGCFNGRQDRGEEGVDCGGVCAAVCLPAEIQPLAFGEPRVFQPVPGKASVLIAVDNPNLEIAAKNFGYRIELYDSSGTILASRSGASFIYAGERNRRLLDFFDISPRESAAGARVIPGAPEWLPAARYPRPLVDIPEKRTEAAGNSLSAGGKIQNRDTAVFPAVEVIAVFKNGFGLPVGVSKTELDNVGAGETRAWSISHPPLPSVDPARTDYFVYARRP